MSIKLTMTHIYRTSQHLSYMMMDVGYGQWSPNAVQYLGRTSRGFKAMREKRAKDFQKYSKVEVLGYQVHYAGSAGDTAELGASYYMNFYGRDGTVIKEHGILESYKVRYSREAGQWQIVENRDYIGKKP